MQKAEVPEARHAPPSFSTIFQSDFFLLETGAGGETRTLVGPNARQFTKLRLSLLSHAGVE